MKNEQQHVLLSRKIEVLRSIKNQELLLDLLATCGLIDEGEYCSSVIDGLLNTSRKHNVASLFEQFCFALATTGNFDSFSKLADAMDSSHLSFNVPANFSHYSDFLHLNSAHKSPSTPARLCLRKFNNKENVQMSSNKKTILNNCVNLFESQLKLEPVLAYFQFYEVFSLELVSSIMDRKQDKISTFLACLTEAPDYALERLCHGLVLSQQWKLFTILHGFNVLDLKILEEMAAIHFEFIHNSVPFQPLSVSDTKSAFTEFAEIPEPAGYLEINVDVADSKELAEITGNHEYYPNFSAPKGLALIINNINFIGYPDRNGSDVDEGNIKNLLKGLGYGVDFTRKNLTSTGFIEMARKFVQHPYHKMSHSCVIVVMTHGQYESFVGSDDKLISIHEFIACFNAVNAPMLAGKPKVFIFQACRGEKYDFGVYQKPEVDRTDGLTSVLSCFGMSPRVEMRSTALGHAYEVKPADLDTLNAQRQREVAPSTFVNASSRIHRGLRDMNRTRSRGPKMPTEGDMIIAYATTPNYVSWRNSSQGTWFIQSICEVFSKHAKTMDILKMFTRVNKRVAEVYQSSPKEYKQTPEIHHRLRKEFFFFPGITNPNESLNSTLV